MYNIYYMYIINALLKNTTLWYKNIYIYHAFIIKKCLKQICYKQKPQKKKKSNNQF